MLLSSIPVSLLPYFHNKGADQTVCRGETLIGMNFERKKIPTSSVNCQASKADPNYFSVSTNESAQGVSPPCQIRKVNILD